MAKKVDAEKIRVTATIIFEFEEVVLQMPVSVKGDPLLFRRWLEENLKLTCGKFKIPNPVVKAYVEFAAG